jgi:hypothetical protein
VCGRWHARVATRNRNRSSVASLGRAVGSGGRAKAKLNARLGGSSVATVGSVAVGAVGGHGDGTLARVSASVDVWNRWGGVFAVHRCR